MCADAFLSKKGNMDALRDRLVGSWMAKAKVAEISLWAKGIPPSPSAKEVAALPAVAASSSSANESAPSLPAACAQSTGQGAGANAPSASADPPGNAVNRSQSQSVLESCQLVIQPATDMSNFFTDLDKGPQIGKDEITRSTADIIAEADVVIPVAAMVKMLHALHEDGSGVALLIAGWGQQSDSFLVVLMAATRLRMCWCYDSIICYGVFLALRQSMLSS